MKLEKYLENYEWKEQFECGSVSDHIHMLLSIPTNSIKIHGISKREEQYNVV